MELNVLKWDRERIELMIEGVPLPLLNAIRRYSLAKVPTYAIDEVMVIVNTSAMFDEILAHRLSMIPLRSEESLDKQGDIEPDMCSRCGDSEEKPPAEVCEKCYIHMVLEAESSNGEVTVYSNNIKSEDPYVKPVYGNIPIVILAPGQKISLELRARIGRGLEHAKWSPATVAIVRHVPNISLDKSRCNMCGKCVEVCPKGVFKMDGGGIVINNLHSCIVCKQCVYTCPLKAIDITIDENKNIVRIESCGSLNPETIIRKSATILLNELKTIYELTKQWRLGGG
ncbi:MAG: DNA-directed RNA polymerase subunit D [Ignisphaera sp.]|nr:DNA-directed RNA polymerase subunit D [Ignisphaera sp.]MCX8167827.1 DNA-directed RNA polymerase subunit D [Ignisphaera sp.]MDW8085808.1 DNA-directed RNA polymerase subunit D [Ignisphaera sp.]